MRHLSCGRAQTHYPHLLYSHLDLQQFCTVDNSLVGTAGMTRKINRYSASNATQKLAMRAGNTESIEVTYAPFEYGLQTGSQLFQFLALTPACNIAEAVFSGLNAKIFADCITPIKEVMRIVKVQKERADWLRNPAPCLYTL